MNTKIAAIALAALLAGCADQEEAQTGAAGAPAEDRPRGVEVYGDFDARLSPEELERGRLDASWHEVVQLDSVPVPSAAGGDSLVSPEAWDSISAAAVNQGATRLPLYGDVAGPSVLRVQVLLDRVRFSPGIIDGRWGKNTEKAIYWLQRREGLPATGRVDQSTFDRLVELAGQPAELVAAHRLTQEDVEGPFVDIPEDIYEQAELECMCYESLAEKLAERFHTSIQVLEQLNPGTDLNAIPAGETLQVPAVREVEAPSSAPVARLVISDGGFYLHALDAQDRIVYHFPTTLGSDYAPSPTGEWTITNIAPDPTWHYQPDLLTGVPDHEEDAVIPQGPNNAVGVVWMELSKPHYGIHGTSAPETIGYTTSHGCVRLTNWDALDLSERIESGVGVEFIDVDNPGSVTE